jgi:hypothetical protein
MTALYAAVRKNDNRVWRFFLVVNAMTTFLDAFAALNAQLIIDDWIPRF